MVPQVKAKEAGRRGNSLNSYRRRKLCGPRDRRKRSAKIEVCAVNSETRGKVCKSGKLDSTRQSTLAETEEDVEGDKASCSELEHKCERCRNGETLDVKIMWKGAEVVTSRKRKKRKLRVTWNERRV